MAIFSTRGTWLVCELTVVATIAEKLVGMRLLKIAAPDFLAGDLGGYRQHWRAAAMAIIKPINEVHVPGSATPGADRQLAGHMGLRPGRECSRFLVTHADPLNVFTLADFLQQAIKRIAHYAVDPFHASGDQRFDNHFRYEFLSHKIRFVEGLVPFALRTLIQCTLEPFKCRATTRLRDGISFRARRYATIARTKTKDRSMAGRQNLSKRPEC
jgi:hypothetical protein